jgi:hypothetical protein
MSTPFIWSSEAQSIGKVSCNLTKEMNNFVVSCWTLLSLEVCVTGALDLILYFMIIHFICLYVMPFSLIGLKIWRFKCHVSHIKKIGMDIIYIVLPFKQLTYRSCTLF